MQDEIYQLYQHPNYLLLDDIMDGSSFTRLSYLSVFDVLVYYPYILLFIHVFMEGAGNYSILCSLYLFLYFVWLYYQI